MLGELYVAERTMGSRLEERRGRLEARRQVSELRSKDRSPGQLHRRVAGALAHQLVAGGARLVGYGLPPYRPTRGESNGGSRGTLAA
jgi:hypothetical protein